MLIRLFDIAIGIVGTVILAIIYPIIALLIKLDSKGPVIYKCDRVGLNGKIFKMYKFRTMYDDLAFRGPSVSPQGDPRVTRVGRILRRTKLNEFPQFLNVLKGDMAVIGPRPESPDLAQLYPPEARRIFSVRPGLIGPNQIRLRNEEELYPPGVDPQKYYIEQILPRKLPVDLEYIDNRSLLLNFKYLLQAAWVVLAGAIGRRHLLDNRSQIFLFVTDSCLCLLSFTLAHVLRFEGLADPASNQIFYRLLPWVVLIRMPFFISAGFYYVLIRHLSLYDLKKVFKGVLLGSLTLVGVSYLTGLSSGYSRAVFLIDWLGLTAMLTGYRALAKKLYLFLRARGKNGRPVERVLIWGAGDCGELCLRYLQKDQSQNYEVVGFIDDDRSKQGKQLSGVRILGDRYHMAAISQIYKVDKIFIAVASAPWMEIQKMMDFCSGLGLKPRLFSIQVGLPTVAPCLCNSIWLSQLENLVPKSKVAESAH